MEPDRIVESITDMYLSGMSRTVCLWGKAGIGKSEMARTLTSVLSTKTGHDFQLIDFRPAYRQPVDLAGFPVPNHEEKTMGFYVPSFFPRDPESYGVLFIDEVTAVASKMMQATLYQLLHDRCIGDWKIPDGWCIVCASNNVDDRSIVNQMPAPLSNRLIHIDYEMSVEQWHNWAVRKQLNPLVIAFHKSTGGKHLHAFDPRENPRSFPTRRSWEMVSELMDAVHNPIVLSELIAGTIGVEMNARFEAFISIKTIVQKHLQNIIANPSTADTDMKIEEMYAVCTFLAVHIARKGPDCLTALEPWWSRIPDTFSYLVVADAGKMNSDVCNCQSYSNYMMKGE